MLSLMRKPTAEIIDLASRRPQQQAPAAADVESAEEVAKQLHDEFIRSMEILCSLHGLRPPSDDEPKGAA